jgi:hypothetical protein
MVKISLNSRAYLGQINYSSITYSKLDTITVGV